MVDQYEQELSKDKMETFAPSLDFMSSYAGKNVIVSGASGAVGYQVTEQLLRAGAANVLLLAN